MRLAHFFLGMIATGMIGALVWSGYRLSGGRTQTEGDFLRLLIGYVAGVLLALMGLILLIADQGIGEG